MHSLILLRLLMMAIISLSINCEEHSLLPGPSSGLSGPGLSSSLSEDDYNGRLLEPIDLSADKETISYLLPKLTAKYRPNNDWSGVTDPRFYLLTEMDTNNIIDNQEKYRRSLQRRSPAISITAPIDVLRKSWQNERTRQQMEKNRHFLNNLK